jgi:hypothetical protein
VPRWTARPLRARGQARAGTRSREHPHVQMPTVTSSSVKSKSRRRNGTNIAGATAWPASAVRWSRTGRWSSARQSAAVIRGRGTYARGHAPSQRHAAGSLIGRILTGRPCVSRWQNSTVATGYVGPVDRQGPERVTAKGFGPGRADDAKGFPGAYFTSLAAGASHVAHSPCSCSYTMLLL